MQFRQCFQLKQRKVADALVLPYAIDKEGLIFVGEESAAILDQMQFVLETNDFKAKKNEILPVFSNYFFPACLGACETWLALGEFRQARHYAEQLQNRAAGAPERTYLALSYWMHAEIFLKEGSLDEAESQIAEALNIIEQAEVPLAAWRVHATAEKFYSRLGDTHRADICQRKKQGVIQKLIQSMPSSDPLHKGLSSLIENNSAPFLKDQTAQIIPCPRKPNSRFTRPV